MLALMMAALWWEPAAAQCAMCRRALDSPEGRELIAALRSGILVLLATPFVLTGTIATLALRAQRRRSAAPTAGLASREASEVDGTRTRGLRRDRRKSY
jgi:hypothetical protein